MNAKHLSLALQGGGAHGAFTWGVLDRLLDEHALEIEAISGTSAGAMNALMLAQGWCEGEHLGAQNKLAEFWHRVAESSPSRWLTQYGCGAFGNTLQQGMNRTLMQFSKGSSPYDLNPMDINPLRDLVTEMVDFALLREQQPFKLFIAATHVKTGKIKLFREQELEIDHVMASACLPTIHKAIQIDGEFYWDGGYSGNPALYPLILDCNTEDILIVLLQPLERDELPMDSSSISARIAEFSFNNAFLREMRDIVQTHETVKGKYLLLGTAERRVKKLKFHLIETHERMAAMPQSSKYDTRLDFLLGLKALGRQEADAWLNGNVGRIGKESSLDLSGRFG